MIEILKIIALIVGGLFGLAALIVIAIAIWIEWEIANGRNPFQ